MAAAYEEILKKIQDGLIQKKEAAHTATSTQQNDATATPAAAAATAETQQHHEQPAGQEQQQYEQQSHPASPSFKVLYDNICQRVRSTGILDKVMKDFQELKTDLERVTYISQMEEVTAMQLEENFSTKNEEDANNYEKVYEMLIPNEASANKAFEVIQKCLQKTPADDSTVLAVRYMKRGWASILLEHFDDAFADAKRSLSLNCPEEQLWNSYEILGHCSARLQDNKGAESYFHKALESLRRSSVANEVKATATVRIMTVYKTVKSKKSKKGSKNQSGKAEHKPVLPQVSYGPHKNFPSASSALDFVFTEDRGRCVIATRDIKPGDILMVDTAFCSFMNPDYIASHCFHCYRRSHTPVPCNSCAKVWYCSEACRSASWSSTHERECHVLSHLIDPGIGKMAFLAFRVLTTVTWAGLCKLRGHIDKLVQAEVKETVAATFVTGKPHLQGEFHPPPSTGEDAPDQQNKAVHKTFTWEGKYFPRDYKTVFHLTSNSTKRTFGDLFKRSITAVYLVHCLRVSGYFGQEIVKNEDMMFAASLLLRHLQSASCNAYEIGEFTVCSESVLTSKTQEVGGALYTTISLTNHSCNENTTRYSVGDKCVLRATRTIPRGAEVLDNYGFLFYVNTVNERNETLLNQYKFKCSCEACQCEWPLYPHHPAETLIFRCPGCRRPCCYSTSSRTKCNLCGNQEQYGKLLQELEQQMNCYRDALNKVRKGDVASALPVLLAHITFLDRHIVEPVKHYTDAHQATKQCFNFQGNVSMPREVVSAAQSHQRAAPKLKAAKKEVIVPH